jgi:hypothetical protein
MNNLMKMLISILVFILAFGISILVIYYAGWCKKKNDDGKDEQDWNAICMWSGIVGAGIFTLTLLILLVFFRRKSTYQVLGDTSTWTGDERMLNMMLTTPGWGTPAHPVEKTYRSMWVRNDMVPKNYESNFWKTGITPSISEKQSMASILMRQRHSLDKPYTISPTSFRRQQREEEQSRIKDRREKKMRMYGLSSTSTVPLTLYNQAQLETAATQKFWKRWGHAPNQTQLQDTILTMN